MCSSLKVGLLRLRRCNSFLVTLNSWTTSHGINKYEGSSQQFLASYFEQVG